MILMIFASGIPNVEKMREKKDVKGLIKALGDEKDSNVRGNAAIALSNIGDSRAVEPLIRLLHDAHSDVRWNAAEALGKIGEPTVEPLIRALMDGSNDVRQNAAQALGTVGDARAVEPLIRALGDSDWRVLWNAARALGKIGDPRAVEPLILLLRDPLIEGRDPVRGAIRRALEKPGSAPQD
jgi:HEAT repeat protein